MTIINTKKSKNDIWIHSVCDGCISQCPIKVHRVNDVVIKIEGDFDDSDKNGKACAKGLAGTIGLYDPSRLDRPLKRTNPEKGIGIDPKWQEISWDEALENISKKLTKIKREDPRKLQLSLSSVDPHGGDLAGVWASAFGTQNNAWLGYFCGNYLHSAMYLTNGTYRSHFDIDNCNYVILPGNQTGFMAGTAATLMAEKMADARMRGMKVIVVDPILTNAAGKSDEWIPIRPGTDGAWFISLINVLVNELQLYDEQFIKEKSNAPYLVGPDGYYVRRDGKPLVWDCQDNIAKPFDGNVKDFAITGIYNIDGIECRPAFYFFREAVKAYSPERVAKITTISAEITRRIAKEFGEAAQIGSTRIIDGYKIPYRPVAVNIWRGVGAHAHGVFIALAIQALNLIVGSYYSIGGHRGSNLIGPEKSWIPRISDDGLVIPHTTQRHGADFYDFEVSAPKTTHLAELLPISTNRSAVVQHAIENPIQFKVPYKIEMLMILRHNQLMTTASPARTAEVFKKIPFIVYFATHEDEQAAFADILLPDLHYLETLHLFLNSVDIHFNLDPKKYYWHLRQPIVSPPGKARSSVEVMLDLAERTGFAEELYRIMNVNYKIKKPYQLDPKQKYSLEQIYDRRAKSMFGKDKGLEWFKENGFHKVDSSIEERYPSSFLPIRFPLYYENVLKAGQEVKIVAEELGIDWNTTDYQASLYWKPCESFSEEVRDDFYVVNFRVPIHSLSYTIQNPWLNELGKHHSQAYYILINSQAAEKLKINNGDIVKVESEAGFVVGKIKLTQGIHPEVLGIAGIFGAKSKGRPIAQDTGVHFNSLLPIDLKRTDPISGGLDSCIRATLTKITP